MRVGVIGINHKLADLKLRELLAKCCAHRFSLEKTMHGLHCFILLSTCNRTEIYFSSEDLATTHSYLLQILRNDIKVEFEHKLYTYFGTDCFKHLCRVTAGFDSAILAETEIQGQVKNAYESTIAYQCLTKEMHFMFQKALKIGKQIRSNLAIRRGMPDLEHALFSTGQQYFSTIKSTNILFVGASAINLKIIAFLKNKGCSNITICNRTAEKSYQAASLHSLNFMKWQDLPLWNRFDWVIFGTKSPEYLIHKDSSSISNSEIIHQVPITKLLIDLSVPRNIDPNISKIDTLTLLNIDQLNKSLKSNKQKIFGIINEAEKLIDQAVYRHTLSFSSKKQHFLHILAG